MKIRSSKLASTYLSHLIATSDGMDCFESIKRYIRIYDQQSAKNFHIWLVSKARQEAKLHKIPYFKLIGLRVIIKETRNISYEKFKSERDWSNWTESSVLSLYHDQYPMGFRMQRRQFLKERQRHILLSLNNFIFHTPQGSDPLEYWLSGKICDVLKINNINNMGTLLHGIATKPNWAESLVGIQKARAILIVNHTLSLFPKVKPANNIWN